MSLDQFASSQLRDNWKELNLHQLDATMGQKWMQNELRKRFGIDGGYTNLDLRTETVNGKHPHVRADFTRTPFRNGAFSLILFDPPFLVDRRSISGHDYRMKTFSQYTRPVKLHQDYAGGYGWKGGGEAFGSWLSRADLRKQLYAAFTELRRILAPEGRIIFKWTDSDATLKYALSLKNGLQVDRIWKRRSKGGKHSVTYYVWMKKGVNESERARRI